MYIVSIQNGDTVTQIHNSDNKLSNGKVTKGINTIDSFQFTMLPSNAGFNEIYDYTTLVTVYNTNRARYEFYGRALYSEDEMSDSGDIKKDVICESFLGFFCDSQQEYVEERNWTVNGLLEHIISTHNSQMESHKQFTIGEVTVTDPNDNLYCGIQRENTWDTLKKKLINTLGGEFRFRVVDGMLYLDYLVEIGGLSQTKIEMSKNMKSIVREKDPSEIVTRLVPLGCKLKTVDDEGNETETEYRLNVSEVNDGKNYIDDETAIALYGIRVGIIEYDDVTVASTLLAKGRDWLEKNNKIQVSYNITALDLSLIGLEIDDFDVCNYHVVDNPLLGINDTARIIKKTIDICEEVKSTIEFGDNFEKMSEALIRQSNAVGAMSEVYVTNASFTSAITNTTTLINQTEENVNLTLNGINDRMSELENEIDEISVRVGTSDHTQLTNRDVSDQHPISAITDLENELGAKLSDIPTLTNIEIEKILT